MSKPNPRQYVANIPQESLAVILVVYSVPISTSPGLQLLPCVLHTTLVNPRCLDAIYPAFCHHMRAIVLCAVRLPGSRPGASLPAYRHCGMHTALQRCSSEHPWRALLQSETMSALAAHPSAGPRPQGLVPACCQRCMHAVLCRLSSGQSRMPFKPSIYLFLSQIPGLEV